jgi:DNA (cytosine-5)-methyltransferase 1
MMLVRRRNGDSELLVHDLFCGAGGASLGLRNAGFTLAAGLNHWNVAIATHSANFPGAEHLCEDANAYDMRRLPYARVLWASPICTELSPAGGNKRDKPMSQQIALLAAENDEEPPENKESYVRTRATFHDVIRATEVWGYDAVVVENVVELASKWRLFDWWLDGMRQLGYNVQFVSVSSAHVGGEDNLPAPQWRDRLYLVFTREGIRLPDVQPRPLAHCRTCEQDVHAVQSWKNPRKRKIGKYGRQGQYVYRCPNVACRNAIIEPYVMPATTAIDWSDLGTPIGERSRSRILVPATRRRVRTGLEMFAVPGSSGAPTYPSFLFNVNHGAKDSGRHFLPGQAPLAARSTKIGEGMVSQPFITMLRNHGTATGIDAPLQALAASGNHHGLTVPPGAFLSKHHGGLDYKGIEHMNKSVHDPMPGLVGKTNISMVIPYRKGATPHLPGGQPLSTVATVEQHALASVEPAERVVITEDDIDACLFRMLKSDEHLAAQRFTPDYVVVGSGTERTMQAGNAVSVNVPQWIGGQLMDVLQ